MKRSARLFISLSLFLLSTTLAAVSPAKYRRIDHLLVETQNERAYQAKLDLVERAQSNLDLAYFIYGDDFSSSYFTRRLLEKATDPSHPVKVRLLVDALMTSSEHELFKMLVQKGKGNIQVAYFRPVPPEVGSDLRSWGFEDPDAVTAALITFDLKKIKSVLATNRFLRKSEEEPQLAFLAPGSLADLWKSSSLHSPTELFARQLADLQGFLADRAASPEAKAAIEAVRFHPRKWLSATERIHHKLLIADGRWVMGGGRNIEDAYHWDFDHPLRAQLTQDQQLPYVFMDVDFAADSPALARDAKATFETYWSGGIGVQEDGELESAKVEARYRDLLAKAERFAPYAAYQPPSPVQNAHFETGNVEAAYVENTMLPQQESGIHAEWVRLIGEARPGQKVILQNAYLYLPPSLELAVVRALARGVHVTLMTNSAASSDLGFIAQMAQAQYRQLLGLGAEIFEYHTRESLHAKISVISDEYLLVGSVNADPRCEFLDSNNAIIVHDSDLASRYRQWLESLRDQLGDKLREVKLATLPPPPTGSEALKVLEEVTRLSVLDSEEGAAAREFLRILFLEV